MKQRLPVATVLEILELPANYLEKLFTLTEFDLIEKCLEDLKTDAKKNYLALCKRYHPDKTGGSDEQIKTINNAWDHFKSIRYQPPAPRGAITHIRINVDGSRTTVSTRNC